MSVPQNQSSTKNWLRLFSRTLAYSTLFLIFAGGMVKSTNSGLAVPDWPLSYGTLFPPMIGGVFYEHGHRMIATFVGFLTLILAIWLGIKEERAWIKNTGYLALVCVILQGVLGGITVLLFLPDIVSISHGVLAQTFFLVTIFLSYSLSNERRNRESDKEVTRSSLLRISIFCMIAIYIQLILGALMRHTESGLAIYDFPTMAGSWFPQFNSQMLSNINSWRFDHNLENVTMIQVIFHFIHRTGAFFVACFLIMLNIVFFEKPIETRRIKETIYLLDAFIIIQIILGVLTIWTEKSPFITSLHVMIGAACLGISFLLVMRIAPINYSDFIVLIKKKGKSIISSFIELTKPRIMMLVLVTTVLGYYLGGKGIHNYTKLFYLMMGSGLVCSGSSVINHYLEREFDSKMNRTKNRPIPSGRILPPHALNFGVILSLLGIFVLYTQNNILTAFLSLLTSFLYILVYTPMKRTSWLNTTIGAIPGAIPPLGGWAAATGTLDFNAGMLFLIMFIWQHPHFYAIAWLFKEDYQRGGFKMLPIIEPDGKKMFDHILIFSAVLIPISLVLTITGLTGIIYFCGASIAGIWMFLMSRKFFNSHSIVDARKLLRTTIIYLPVLLALIIIDVQF